MGEYHDTIIFSHAQAMRGVLQGRISGHASFLTLETAGSRLYNDMELNGRSCSVHLNPKRAAQVVRGTASFVCR